MCSSDLDSKQSQGALLLQLITRFASDFRDSIDGRGAEYSTNELFGGARINYIFTENYAKCLSHIDPTDGLSLSDIRTAIKNVTVRSYCDAMPAKAHSHALSPCGLYLVREHEERCSCPRRPSSCSLANKSLASKSQACSAPSSYTRSCSVSSPA